MQDDNINDYLPSILNPRAIKKQHDFSLTQNSIVSRCSLSLKRPALARTRPVSQVINKENSLNLHNLNKESQIVSKNVAKSREIVDNDSLGLSAIEDLQTTKYDSSPASIYDIFETKEDMINKKTVKSYLTVSSDTELDKSDLKIESTAVYYDKPHITVSFEVKDCPNIDVNAKNSAINRFFVSHKENSTNIDCDLIENSVISTETEVDENMNNTSFTPKKRPAVSVDIEIKKQKLTDNNSTENSKVLILNTNAIEKISHVIVQPPNYKFVKRNKIKSKNKGSRNGNVTSDGLKQISIDSFFRKNSDVTIDVSTHLDCVNKDGAQEMSMNLGVNDTVKCERMRSRSNRREVHDSPKSARLCSKRDLSSPKKQDIKSINSDAPAGKVRNEMSSSQSLRKNVEPIYFSLSAKSKSNKTSVSPRNIPHHKIVAGTHFAVDAFSYGDIPNVKHYFLTHFHSDHYSGLKKTFNKLLFCSKITAELCITRLGVNPKCIHTINVDDTIKVESVEVTAVDANHCPGALMLVFTLPNGKTLLHTGDFRACPTMESYPIFWNKDIHTIYLDTTYCNPRYDFPTQDQSLEMALYILRQKKMALEKVGKKFSSVLIVCGTYTIGKEKFFMGMARRVGCSVWACPEKERVLQTVEGKSTTRDQPHLCQLHIVPMRDLTHEKLRSYLDSLQGSFSELVAFKPSGWENGKNSCVERDQVTIHGIPYSEHSSFSELIRFVKFLNPKQVVPTVDIAGGVKSVQKYFCCPLVYKEELQSQSKVSDYFSIHSRQQMPAVT